MTSDRNLHTGALFLVMSNGLTATVDTVAKYMSPSLHGVQVVWGYSLAITVLVLGYAAFRPEPLWRAFATRRPLLQFGRGAMLFATISMLFVALAKLPLADVIAISFAAPLFIILLAAPLLSERIEVHRFAAVVFGLAGVAIVMRPGAGVFEWAALLALASAVFFAFFRSPPACLPRPSRRSPRCSTPASAPLHAAASRFRSSGHRFRPWRWWCSRSSADWGSLRTCA